MTFDDDEQIYGIQIGTAGFENEVPVGNAKVKIINVPYALPEQGRLKVLVELTGKGKPDERPGLDLVIVLDVSENMKREDRLDKVKKATEFVIKKLSPVDRVSVVTFSDVANKLCGLRQIKKDSRRDIVSLVDAITSAEGRNIFDGLEMALKVLSGRKFKEDRNVGIILMSSDEQDQGRNAAEVEVADIPVYTFGFGTGSKDNLTKPHVLDAIARKSAGGKYSDVGNGEDLSVAFAHCFARLMTVAIQDLKLIMSPENMSTVENVYAGEHEQSKDGYTVSVMLGNLYDKETRKVLVHVRPPVTEVVGLQVLKVAYKYRNELGKERKSTPLHASKKQIENFTQEEKDDLTDEVIHLERASFEDATKGDIGELPSFSTPYGDTNKQQEALKRDDINKFLSNEEEMKKETTPVSSKVPESGEVEKPPSTVCIAEADLSGETIAPSIEVATEGDVGKLSSFSTPVDTNKKQETFGEDDINPLVSDEKNVKKETTPLSSLVAERNEIKNPPSNLCTNGDDLEEKTVTPLIEVATKSDVRELPLLYTQQTNTNKKLGEPFDKDDINLENVKKVTAPPSYLPSTPYRDIHKKQGGPFEKDDKNPSPTDKEDLEKETTAPSSEVATSDDVKNSPSFEVPVSGLMKRLLLFFAKLLWFFNLNIDTQQNPKRKTTPLSPKVSKSAGVEKLPSTLGTNEDDLRGKTIAPSFEAATKGDVEEDDMPSKEKMEKETTRPSFEVAATGDVEISLLDSTKGANKDDLNEETISPSFKVTVRGLMKRLLLFFTKLLSFFKLDKETHQKQGKSFEKDNKNSWSTKNENVMRRKTTTPSSKIVASGDVEEPLLSTSPITNEEDLKEDMITSSFKVATRGYMQNLLLLFTKPLGFSNLSSDTHRNQGDLFKKDMLNPLPANEDVKKEITSPSSEVTTSVDEEITTLLFSPASTDKEDLEEEKITPPSKDAAKSYMQILFSIFTKLSLIFNLRNTHQKQLELSERDYKKPVPANKENTDGETTPVPSESAASGNVKIPPLFSSPSVDENVLKEDNIKPSFIAAARGYIEKLVSLFIKLLLFFNLRNRTHQEGESLKKDHTSSMRTKEENVKEENTESSSEVATSGDVHQKQAGFSLLPTDKVTLDGTFTTSSKVAARGYIKKLLLFFNPRMDTNQKQAESPPNDVTDSLSTEEHHEKEHKDFVSTVNRKFVGCLTAISNSVANQNTRILTSFQELGITSFAYSYSPVLLIQDTHRSLPNKFKTFMKVTLLSAAVATVLYMLCVCLSYADFRHLVSLNILYGLGFYNPFCLLDIAMISLVFLLVGAYQVYNQPLFKFIDKLAARFFPNNDFIIKEHDIPLLSGFRPFEINLSRLVWRTIFVIITTIILMLIPFFKEVVDIVGAFGFWPLTVYYPVDMYIIHKKIPDWSSKWITLQILCVVCLIIGTAASAGSFAAVVTDLKVFMPFQSS